MERVLFDDVIYYNDKFYTLIYGDRVSFFDVTDSFESNLKSIVDEISMFNEKNFGYKKYLVESYGRGFWQVQPYIKKGFLNSEFNHVTKKLLVIYIVYDFRDSKRLVMQFTSILRENTDT